MTFNKFFNYLVKVLWLLVFFLVILLDRDKNIMVVVTISILIVATILTIIRSIVARNEWRQLIENGDVEIQEKIKF